jgi:bisphosphoglycerate-dependent phosphoglycerate mutase
VEINPSLDEHWFARFENAETADARKYILANPGDIIVAEQLHCYPKAAQKFPKWHKNHLVYTRLALEQSSGEFAAQFKASLIQGKTLVDLTGGLGMDTFAFAHQFEHVIYTDLALQPYLLAKHNHRILTNQHYQGIVENQHKIGRIEHFNQSAEVTLQITSSCDWIYIDPSRRDTNRRFFKLSDCEPDILAMWNTLREKSAGIMLKLSPMYDISQLLREIPDISKVIVLSVSNEVKEILALCEPIPSHSIVSVSLPDGVSYSKTFDEFESKPGKSTTPPGKYLHVPDVAITKAGLTNKLADKHNLNFISQGSDYLTTDIPPNDDSIGTSAYEILEVLPYKPKDLRKRFSGQKVNIHRRDFPLSPPEIYKKTNLSMGDDFHLFFTTLPETGMSVIVAKPLLAKPQFA